MSYIQYQGIVKNFRPDQDISFYSVKVVCVHMLLFRMTSCNVFAQIVYVHKSLQYTFSLVYFVKLDKIGYRVVVKFFVLDLLRKFI